MASASLQPQGKAEDGGESVVGLLDRGLTEGVTGPYYDVGRPAPPDQQAADPEARRRLQELSDALLGRALG